MRVFLLGAALALLALSPSSAGERGWYLSVEAGSSDTHAGGGYTELSPPFLTSWDFSAADESITLTGTAGTHLTDELRVELELGRRSLDAYAAEVDQTTAMLNVAYDLPVLDQLSITLGVGAGWDFISLDTPVADADGSSFAYQALVGLNLAVAQNIDITLTYRHFDTLDVELREITLAGDTSLTSLDDSSISIGLRFGL